MFDPETGLLPVNVEIQYDGEWHDITDDVEVSDELKVTRGRDDYESSAGPSQLTLSLDNTDGKYVPKNPLSPLYGKIGRNTPIRVRVGEPEPGILFTGDPSTLVSTPDPSGAFSPAGEFFIELDLEPSTWRPDHEMMIVGKGTTSGSVESWAITLNPDNGSAKLLCRTTAGWIFGPGKPVPDNVKRRWFRFHFSPNGLPGNDGSTGHPSIRVWSRDDPSEPWRRDIDWWQSTFAPASVTVTDKPVSIGGYSDGTRAYDSKPYLGVVHSISMTDGAGAPLFDAQLTSRDSTSPTWSDSEGNTWTVQGTTAWADPSCRMTGEVVQWPPRWDSPGHARAIIEAAGIRRRLDRNSTPLKSPMFRAVASNEEAYRTAAYWPMEEDGQAAEFASGIGGPSMPRGGISGYHDGDIQLAAYNGFLSSGPLPEFHSKAVSGSVPLRPATGELRVLGMFHLPPEGITGESRIFSVRTSGSCAEWTLIANADGALAVRGKDRQGNEILTSGWGGFDANGDDRLVSLWLTQNGNDIDWQVYTFAQATQIGGAVEDTLAGRTLGSAVSVAVGPRNGEDLAGTAIGHLAVFNKDTATLGSRVYEGFTAHTGELAVDRLVRLASEEDIPLTIGGLADRSEPLGLQTAQSLPDLLDEAAEADLGVLHERRDMLALEYRPRRSLYNQQYITLDYEAGHIVPPFEPTDDDAATRNDVTVNRKGGTSFRATRTDGPLAIDAIGRYDHSVDLSLKEDPQAAHQAGWRLHLGTLDDIRYPRVHVSLHGAPELVESVRRLDVGDRLKITNLPKWLPPDTADLIVQGYEETFDGLRWDIVFNCTPAFSWQVGVADDTTYGRADTSGSELLSSVDAAATDLQVLTTDGPRWVEDPAEFPFDVKVGGEHVTVTAVQPLLSDDFTRPGDGVWGQSLWGSTFIWSA